MFKNRKKLASISSLADKNSKTKKKSRSGRPEVFCKKQVLKKIYKSKVFSCEFCEAFKNTYFVKYLRTTAFENHVHSDSIVQ